MAINITGIDCAILAGGRNTRVGGINKAFIKIGDSVILDKITSVTEKIFNETIIVTNNVEDFIHLKKYTIITDIIKNIGPLGGIYSALNNTNKEALFFVSCDMPCLKEEIIINVLKKYRTAKYEAVVPRIGSFIEPLHAVYSKKIKDILFSFIKTNENYSIRQFLYQINVCFIDIENNSLNKKAFTNINTLTDIETANSELNINK